MVAFVAADDGVHFRATSIGAESNVAISFAQFGGRALWISRLGDDDLGRLIHTTVQQAGVHADVEWDETHPTGAAVKELSGSGTRIRYYRSQSAARHLQADQLPDLTRVGWLHLTGITPALSDAASATVDSAIERARAAGTKMSFDVNLRPPLWECMERARDRLLPLCAAADVIFVGSDESQALTGTHVPEGFAEACGLSDSTELVFKDGPREAVVLHEGRRTVLPAHDVDVVDVTGAGDAFAAGYLAAAREGHPTRTRLFWGHWNAARVVQLPTDLPPTPSEVQLRQLDSMSLRLHAAHGAEK